MRTMPKVLRYELKDVARAKAVLAYGVFFLLVSEGLFRFTGGDARALLSLGNLVLVVVPLVSIVLGAMFVYGAREFTELLLSQPVGRTQLYTGLYLGLTLPLMGAFLLGVGVPAALHWRGTPEELRGLAILVVSGVSLTGVFTALAFLTAVRFEDRVRGLGVALALWLFFALVYDGIVLVAANAFADYPLEGPLLVAVLLNPVDLARVLLMLNFDVSALMGYTGAVFRRFLGSGLGMTLAVGALAVWIAVPLGLGYRLFRRKDF